MDLTGQYLGKYKLIHRLGKGGMAQVYQANQPTIERLVAVKVLHSHLAESDDFVARFKREARGLGQLQHPHIVQVIDFDTSDDLYYMVMDYIPGKTLRAYLDEKGKLSHSEALTLVSQLADALAYAHQKEMIHRDIKPSNVMFEDDSCTHAIVTDFGITRLLNEKSITMTGAMVGTPAYMSPEAVLGEQVDGRSDIYSLGVILYEMVTGRTPYQGNTPLSLVVKQVHEPPPSPLEQNPNLPIEIVEIIEKSLAKSPDKRYQTADEFLHAVQLVQTKLGDPPFGETVFSTTRHIQSEAETAVPAAETKLAEKEAESAAPKPLVNNRLPLYLGLGFVALLIVGGFIWLGQRNAAEENDGVAAIPSATSSIVETAVPEATSSAVEAAVELPTETALPTATAAPTTETTTAPTETAVPPPTATAPLPLIVPNQMGALYLTRGEDQFARTFALRLDRVPLPPAGSRYVLWLELEDGRLLNGGVLTVENGRIRTTGSVDDNLAARLRQVRVSLEPDSNPANAREPQGPVVFRGELSDEMTAVLQTLLEEAGLLFQAQEQLSVARQHAGFAEEALAQNNLTEAKIHAEHVVNILDGETGERFGDVNLDGQAQNPGDGVGVRVYLADAREQLVLLQMMEPITQNRLFYNEQALAAVNNTASRIEEILTNALSLAATDTVAEALPFATAVIDSIEQLLTDDVSQQTLTAAVNQTLVLAQRPLLALETVLPPPDAIAETIPGRVGTIQFRTADGVPGGGFNMALNQIPPLPPSQQMAAWVLNRETNKARFLGFLDLMNGRAELAGSIDENILLSYDTLLVTLQPADAGDVLDEETAVYTANLQTELGKAIAQLVERNPQGLLNAANEQLAIARQHRQFAEDALAAGNLDEAKIHTEHVINILDGEDGDHFGDLNLDGQAQNPGDGVGVRGYWVKLIDELSALDELQNGTANQTFYFDQLAATQETSLSALFTVIEQGQRLLASDTAAEAQPFDEEMLAALLGIEVGTDVDGNGVIDPLLGEGGLTEAFEIVLAIHEVSIFPR